MVMQIQPDAFLTCSLSTATCDVHWTYSNVHRARLRQPRLVPSRHARLKLRVRQAPLNACVCDTEALALRVALRSAAGFGADHGEIAAGLPGVLETALEQQPLRPSSAPLGESTGSSQQSNTTVN